MVVNKYAQSSKQILVDFFAAQVQFTYIKDLRIGSAIREVAENHIIVDAQHNQLTSVFLG